MHDRLLQRRLALLASLQTETVRLERKQRQENSGKLRGNLVYSAMPPECAGMGDAHRRASAPSWNPGIMGLGPGRPM